MTTNWITEPRIVERCRSLNITDLKAKLRYLKTDDSVDGSLSFKHDDCWQNWRYWIKSYYPNASLTIDLGTGYDPQQILLSGQSITYGQRYYFVCGQCGRKTAKLYLPQRTIIFKCRSCWRLKYELQSINCNSKHGKHFYQTHRMIKLANQRERMSKILYRGGYTKRFKRFLRHCSRIRGLRNVVSEATDLVSAINETGAKSNV